MALKQKKQDKGFDLEPCIEGSKRNVLDGKIIFNNNPLMKWYINNVQLKLDRNGNWLPSKQADIVK